MGFFAIGTCWMQTLFSESDFMWHFNNDTFITQFYRCVDKDKCDSSAILIRRRQPDLTGLALAEDASCINSAESEVFGPENSLSQTCCNEKDIKDKEVTIGKTDF